MPSCGVKCLKIFMTLINSVVFIGGALLTGFGIYLLIKAMEYVGRSSDAIILPSFIVSIGFVCFLLGFLGCCGALKENVCMLNTYAIMLSVLVLLELICAILLFALRMDLKPYFESFISNQIADIKTGVASKEHEIAIDHVQEQLQCCGSISEADWEGLIPASCCPNNVKCDASSAYKQGCVAKLFELIKESWLTMGLITLGVCLFEIAVIVFACILQSQIKKTVV